MAKATLPFSRELAHYVLALNRFGPLGVSLFFSLSSYLITKLLLLEESKKGQVSVGHFYVRRALRIWPVYFLSLLVLQFWVTPFNHPMEAGTLAGFVFFLGNWVMAYLGRLHNCVLILWSISVEEQFYLIWPWLFRGGSTRSRVRLFWALLVAAWLIRIAMAAAYTGSQDHRFSHLKEMGFACNSFFHLDTFALGALLAVYEESFRERFARPSWLLFAPLSLLLLARYFLAAPTSVLAALAQGVVAFSCMLVVVNSFTTRWLGHPILVWLGRMTYGLYVYHFFSLRLVEYTVYQGRFPGPDFLPSVATSVGVAGLGLALTVAIATLSFYALESPILRWKSRFTAVPSGKA